MINGESCVDSDEDQTSDTLVGDGAIWKRKVGDMEIA